jgi:hypothetical protein
MIVTLSRPVSPLTKADRDMENLPDSTEKTEITDDLPPGAERRLVQRLLAHWRSIRHEGALPRFSDVDFSDNPDIETHSFVVDLEGVTSAPTFVGVGEELAAHLEAPLVGRPVSAAPNDCLPGAAIAYMDEILDKGAPVSRGGELVTADGTTLLYRSILLPMSDDGETITGILGAANCRIVEHAELLAH